MSFNTNDISYIDGNGNRITVGTNTPLPTTGAGGGGSSLTQPTTTNPFYDALVYMGAIVSDSNPLGVKIVNSLPSGTNNIGYVRLLDSAGTNIQQSAPSTAASATDRALVVQISPNSPVGRNTLPNYDKGAYVTTTDAVAQSVNAVATTMAAQDAVDFQSISIQVNSTATYTGTFTFQISNDNVNWNNKALIAVNNGNLTTGTAPSAVVPGIVGIYQGDIGARYIRVLQNAWTAGSITVIAAFSAFSTSTIPTQTPVLATGSNVVGTVRATPNHTSDQTNSTAQLASGTYTAGIIDQGADTTLYGSRLRVGVQHLAGLVLGHLTMEQSDDGTTYRETDRVPVPADGYMHNYGFTIVSRYLRTKFINGTVTQTLFYHHSYRIGVEGPTPDSGNNTAFPLSVTALGASSAFTSPVFDLGNNHSWTVIRALAAADQAGTISVQQSRDNTTWRATRPAEAGLGATLSGNLIVTAANAQEYGDFKIMERYLRIVFTNTTATAMTVTDLNAVLLT